ncbi:unnamed protein product [Prorocentrum cordatum]|uniref:Uncharacterized protein n=1 Tax=Prorocentrum cordatum TaxID=2364126 RepID=A0ABN9VIU4_9DINO|nr:unnamed protein product [Polarella glacialis]
MADVQTLDIGDPQILVRYEYDPLYRHHRVLLFRVGDDIWICPTRDHDLVREKLLCVRHEVYAHDPISGAMLAGSRRRAKLQGQVLGVVQVDTIERMVLVVAEPRSDKFGEIVDAAVMDDENRGRAFDQKEVAAIIGEEVFAQKIAASQVIDFKKDVKAQLGDIRTLGGHLDEANFPLSGVRGVKEFLESVASSPGSVASHQAEWQRLSGVGKGSAVIHVHRILCEAIRLMHSWDQVDLFAPASAELIVRLWIQTGEQKQNRKGDGKGSDGLDPANPKRRPRKPKGGNAGAAGGAGEEGQLLSGPRGRQRRQSERRESSPAADYNAG